MVDKKIFLVLLLLLPIVLAQNNPQFTVEFRGQAYDNGKLVSDGTEVSIWADDRKMDTSIAGYGKGYYNHLEVKWDDKDTFQDEGVSYDFEGEEIVFKIGDKIVEKLVVTRADSGKTITLNLDSPREPIIARTEGFSNDTFLQALLVVAAIIIVVILAGRKDKKKGDKKS